MRPRRSTSQTLVINGTAMKLGRRATGLFALHLILTWFYLVSTWFYWFLSSFTRFYWVLLRFTRLHWVSQSINRFDLI